MWAVWGDNDFKERHKRTKKKLHGEWNLEYNIQSAENILKVVHTLLF